MLVLVFGEQCAIALPSYDEVYVSPPEAGEIAAVAASLWPSPTWLPVDGRARDFDVALFRTGRLDRHVGIFCGQGRMLHVCEGVQSGIEDFRSSRWASRLMGIYRHRKLIICA